MRQEQAGLIKLEKRTFYPLSFLTSNYLKYSKEKGKKTYKKDKAHCKFFEKFFADKGIKDIREITQQQVKEMLFYIKNLPTARANVHENATVNRYLALLLRSY